MSIKTDELRREANSILEVIASPEFEAQLESVRREPRERRVGAAATRLTPDALRSAGVGLPEGIRISSRYFEEGDVYTIELGDPDGRIPVVPAINEIQPGLLDRLREEHPDLFGQLVEHRMPGRAAAKPTVCVCAGVGICACVGW